MNWKEICSNLVNANEQDSDLVQNLSSVHDGDLEVPSDGFSKRKNSMAIFGDCEWASDSDNLTVDHLK